MKGNREERAMRKRLASEVSPYLRQHADNPVDWYPWGDEAFDKAKEQDKPVLLSIGYSSCHWCHVMARESFEDEEVASLMNAALINVKVDREEMPHIDHIYMQACQVLTGSGGWPLTVILTPDRQPFFAATYLPKHSRQGLIGMMELIPVIGKLWQEKRDRVIGEAAEIARTIRRAIAVRPGTILNPGLLLQAYEELKARYDGDRGGFGTAPKFPTPQTIMFLLRYFRRSGDPQALVMAEKTLEAMARGGIYDHVGYGFHRYSTDGQWLVPHFEKMLYDQAMLAIAYAEAYQVTLRRDFRKTAEDTLTYVLQDLRTHEGLFAGSEDADSEGEEGRFYLWTAAGIASVLDEADFSLAREAFGLSDDGNAPGMNQGLNIIHLEHDPADLAAKHSLGTETISSRLENILGRLRQARSDRMRPVKDTKALTDWNGLAIAALARCSTILSRPDLAIAAKKAADFILDTMDGTGGLGHVFMAGQVRGDAGLDDYAFLTWGLMELYEATFDPRYLDRAIHLTSVIEKRFRDTVDGGFFSTSDVIEVPIARTKSAYDNALPSGNSVTMLNLLRLGELTGDASLRVMAEEIGKAFSSQAGRIPSAFLFMMCALDFLTGPAARVVIAGDPGRSDTRAMIEAVRSRFLPHAMVIMNPGGPMAGTNHDTEYSTDEDGSPTAYVCTGSTCHRPTMEVEELLDLLS